MKSVIATKGSHHIGTIKAYMFSCKTLKYEVSGIIQLYKEYGTIILVIIEAPAILGCCCAL